MKDFENYECDGQITLEEYMEYLNSTTPKKCCGVTPWLHTTKCCHWDASKPQNYMMYYICPMCGKTVIDEIGWIKYRHGTYEKASKQALEDWNNPKSRFEIKEFKDPKNGNYVNCSSDEREEFEKLYGISYEDYTRPLIEISNRIFREKQLAKQRLGAEECQLAEKPEIEKQSPTQKKEL